MTTNPSPLAASALRRGIDALAVVSLLAAVALIHGPVFGGTTGYVAALGGLVVGVLVAALTAALRVRTIGSTLALAAAYLLTGGALALPTTTAYHVLPTQRTIQMLVVGTITSWKDLLTVQPPAGIFVGPAIMPFLSALVTSFVALTIVLRTTRPAWALAPAGTLGLWVDIFPLERVDITDPAVHRAAKKEHRLVWWKYIAASNPRYATSALRRVVKYMLYPITYFADLYAISRKQDDMARACHRSTVSNVDNERYVLLLDDVMDRNIIRPAELFPTRVASFEGREFAIPAQAEKLLRDYYGNWQEIPPEDQRPPAHVRSVEWVGEQPYAG